MLTAKEKLGQFYDDQDELLDIMKSEISKAVIELAESDKWQEFITASMGFRNYSFRNQMLIYLQKPDALKVASKGYWYKVGRKLKPFAERGNGIRILGGKRGSYVIRDENGEPELDENGEKQYGSYTRFFPVTVYDVSQTTPINENDETSEAISEIINDNRGEEGAQSLIDFCTSQIERAGYHISYQPELTKAHGYTDPKKMKVFIQPSLNPINRSVVLAHEMAHIYAEHVNDMKDYSAHRGIREVEAESIAFMIARIHGVHSEIQSKYYIASWAKEHAKDNDMTIEEVLLESGDVIARTVKALMTEDN